jgi:hypothetical protein
MTICVRVISLGYHATNAHAKLQKAALSCAKVCVTAKAELALPSWCAEDPGHAGGA